MKQSQIFIIAGVAGDLALKKLLPALAQNRCADGICIARVHISGSASSQALHSAIIGMTRMPTSVDDFLRNSLLQKSVAGCPDGQTIADHLRPTMHLVSGDLMQDAVYQQVYTMVSQLESAMGSDGVDRIVYAACPPDLFIPVVTHVVAHRVLVYQDHAITHYMIFEKPFGTDSRSAEDLHATTQRVLSDGQIVRLDHFLAKDIVQTILYTRLTNRIIQPIWTSEHVAAITIRHTERELLDSRGSMYARMGGIITDILQNHLLQLISLVLCKAPDTLDAQDIARAKLQVLESIYFDIGMTSIYEDAPTTAATFVMARGYSRLPAWTSVPIFFIAGKAMHTDETSITLHMKQAECPEKLICPWSSNSIHLGIGPIGSLRIALNVKSPAPQDAIVQEQLEFCYSCQWPYSMPAYSTVLQEIFAHDMRLCVSYKEVAASWHSVESIPSLRMIAPYTAGSEGPTAALTWYAEQIQRHTSYNVKDK